MKKMVFVLLLVVMLLSLTLTAALAACPAGDDPNPPGYANSNENAYQFLVGPPPGLDKNDHGKAGEEERQQRHQVQQAVRF